MLRAVRDSLAAVPDWKPEPLEASLRSLAESRGIAAGKVFQPLRVALTGMTVSPGIFEMLLQMGRNLSLTRIEKAIAALGD
jgi:glutamyl-tRNA synthetase